MAIRRANEARQAAEWAQREAQRRAVYSQRMAEINAHNETINQRIAQLTKELNKQRQIYAENEGKIFGSGAKMKKAAKEEIDRLEYTIIDLKKRIVRT